MSVNTEKLGQHFSQRFGCLYHDNIHICTSFYSAAKAD